jgi:heme a synthase
MQSTQPGPSQPPVAEILALGFGTTVAIWAMAYLLRLPAVNAPAALLTALIATLLLVGGFLAGKYTRRGWKGGAQVGLLSGLLNLLIVSSALSDRPDAMRDLPLFAAGSLALSAVLGLLGGAFGNTRRARAAERPNWTSIFTRVAVAATFLLLIAGGLVTSHRAGLAVPDWPSSFGYNMFLLPLSQMADKGVFLEHAHRLLGSLVGLTTLTLALYFTFTKVNARATLLSWIAFALVVIQGILGGLRVVEINTALGAVHGILGQLIFGLLVWIAVITSAQWLSPLKQKVTPSALIDHNAPLWLLILLVLQIALGADMRHRQADSLLMIHIAVAALVLGLTIFVGVRFWGLYPDVRALRRRGMGLIHITLFQIILGIGVTVMGAPSIGDDPTVGQALVTTMHQANGALLLGWTVGVLLWSRRLLVMGEDVARAVA